MCEEGRGGSKLWNLFKALCTGSSSCFNSGVAGVVNPLVLCPLLLFGGGDEGVVGGDAWDWGLVKTSTCWTGILSEEIDAWLWDWVLDGWNALGSGPIAASAERFWPPGINLILTAKTDSTYFISASQLIYVCMNYIDIWYHHALLSVDESTIFNSPIMVFLLQCFIPSICLCWYSENICSMGYAIYGITIVSFSTMLIFWKYFFNGMCYVRLE